MLIAERVSLYKALFKACKALEPVKGFVLPDNPIEALETIRELNTTLSDLYMVSIPVLTVWVRDSNYVPATQEIYLTEPELEPFLHQFRHHLQNIERRYERRGLTTEGDINLSRIPYEKCIHKMYGEDDAIAWSKFLLSNM
ncbi:MAG: hypothetical protein R3Y09_00115 [Clostridia bacterium]